MLKNTVGQHLYKFNNTPYWEGDSQLSMEGIAMDRFKNYRIVIKSNPSSTFHSYLSEDNKQDAPVTYAHMINIHKILMDEYRIKANGSSV